MGGGTCPPPSPWQRRLCKLRRDHFGTFLYSRDYGLEILTKWALWGSKAQMAFLKKKEKEKKNMFVLPEQVF